MVTVRLTGRILASDDWLSNCYTTVYLKVAWTTDRLNITGGGCGRHFKGKRSGSSSSIFISYGKAVYLL